ncbi:MAG TPA: lipoprotein [Burkholderiales bacterium]|nr:lipoprotein [Burkholderiales bacterium]
MPRIQKADIMRRHLAITAIITLPLLLLLSACGYKGPLYLPPPKPAASPPAPVQNSVTPSSPPAAAQPSTTQKPGEESDKP